MLFFFASHPLHLAKHVIFSSNIHIFVFNILSKSIFVWLPTNSSPTSKFIIYIYFNRNFWCLCKVFCEVPNARAIDFTKRFNLVLDETTAICISLCVTKTFFYLDVLIEFRGLFIFCITFSFIFFNLLMIFEYPIKLYLLFISLMLRDFSTIRLELPQFHLWIKNQ